MSSKLRRDRIRTFRDTGGGCVGIINGMIVFTADRYALAEAAEVDATDKREAIDRAPAKNRPHRKDQHQDRGE